MSTPSQTGQAGTDNELSALLHALRRHVLEAGDSSWDDSTRTAAKTLAAGISARLGRTGPDG